MRMVIPVTFSRFWMAAGMPTPLSLTRISPARRFQRDLDQRCPGVEAVFHKFFDYARGALHDFTRCDLIAQFGGKEVDAAAFGR